MKTEINVLIVEDSRDDADLIMAELARGGITANYERVWTAEGLQKALADGEWDIVLSDHTMPRFSAFDALKIVKETQLQIPFIIISGTIGEETAVAAMKAGADDYFLKDKLTRLPSAVNRLLIEAVHLRERRKAEEALRESEERFRLLIENSRDVAVFMTDPQGIVISWNIGAERIFGYSEHEVLGQSASIFFTPEDLKNNEDQKEMQIAIENGKAEDVRWHLRKDGTGFFADGVTAALHDKDKRLRGFAKIARDRTDRKKQEDALRESRERLEKLFKSEQEARAEAERLFREKDRINRIKDEFLATLSHELRTPLNVIIGMSDLIQNEELSPEDLNECLSAIHRNAQMQSRIVCDLLDVSRIISGKLKLDVQPFDIRSVVFNALETIKTAADKKRIRVNTNFEDNLDQVSGDPARIQQAIWNLLANAVKFTPIDGRIDVALKRVDSMIEVEVRDSGQGIEPLFLPKIFERFSQEDSSTTRQHGGLGLGLAIVRHITEAHGGTVHAESEGRGKGTVFSICLPLQAIYVDEDYMNLAEQNEQEDRRDSLRYKGRPLDGVHVLVIDDEQDARSLIKIALSRAGAEVLLASSASEARAILEMNDIKVVVCDIGMPEEDGYSFISSIRYGERRDGRPRIAAAALTAYATAVDKEKALNSGFDVYLSKPVAPRILLAAVAKLARRELSIAGN